MKKRDIAIVYVIYNPLTKLSKVGFTTDIVKRVSSIECASGMKVVLCYTTIPVYLYGKLEMWMHEEFANDRKIGEWFSTDKSVLIEKLKAFETKFRTSPEVLSYLGNKSISEFLESTGISRQAFYKKLKGWNLLGDKTESKTKPFSKSNGKVVANVIPSGLKKVGRNLYLMKDGKSFLAKKYIAGEFVDKIFEDRKSAESYIAV